MERCRRPRFLPLVLLALAALGLTACGSTVQEGSELTVYVGTASTAPALLEGTRQALEDGDGEAGGAPIEIVAVPGLGGDAAGAGSPEEGPHGWLQADVAAGARAATQDAASIAYIGEPGEATLFSAPITNEAGLLQVAPGPVSRELLAVPGGNDVPTDVQATGDRTLTALRVEGEPRRGGLYAYGYEAMAAVLDAIDRAEDPLSRSDVLAAFLATQDRDSELGTYSIGPDGAADFAEAG